MGSNDWQNQQCIWVNMPMSQLAYQLTKWLGSLPISPLGSRPMSQACQLTHWHANGVTH
jgi:hypothetical protein